MSVFESALWYVEEGAHLREQHLLIVLLVLVRAAILLECFVNHPDVLHVVTSATLIEIVGVDCPSASDRGTGTDALS